MDYTVTIKVSVTASSPEEAAKFALNDLRDEERGPLEWLKEGMRVEQTVEIPE